MAKPTKAPAKPTMTEAELQRAYRKDLKQFMADWKAFREDRTLDRDHVLERRVMKGLAALRRHMKTRWDLNRAAAAKRAAKRKGTARRTRTR